MGKITIGDISGMLAQPFYAINFSESLFGDHEPMISEDEWIKVQIQLLKEMTQEEYFKELLKALKDPVVG